MRAIQELLVFQWILQIDITDETREYKEYKYIQYAMYMKCRTYSLNDTMQGTGFRRHYRLESQRIHNLQRL